MWFQTKGLFDEWHDAGVSDGDTKEVETRNTGDWDVCGGVMSMTMSGPAEHAGIGLGSFNDRATLVEREDSVVTGVTIVRRGQWATVVDIIQEFPELCGIFSEICVAGM